MIGFFALAAIVLVVYLAMRLRWTRPLGVATAVAVLWAGVGALVPLLSAEAAPAKPARDLPAIPSDPAPRAQPEVPDGNFADPPPRSWGTSSSTIRSGLAS